MGATGFSLGQHVCPECGEDTAYLVRAGATGWGRCNKCKEEGPRVYLGDIAFDAWESSIQSKRADSVRKLSERQVARIWELQKQGFASPGGIVQRLKLPVTPAVVHDILHGATYKELNPYLKAKERLGENEDLCSICGGKLRELNDGKVCTQCGEFWSKA